MVGLLGEMEMFGGDGGCLGFFLLEMLLVGLLTPFEMTCAYC